MMKILILFAGLSLIILVACARTDKKAAVQKTDYRDLRTLKIENAVIDAQRAAKSKDFRLLAIRGYTLEVPGTSEDLQSIKSTYGIREIEGTSDAIEGPEHGRLIDNARRYAEKYNRTIIADFRQ
jgi:outer membrane lipoprotein LolB